MFGIIVLLAVPAAADIVTPMSGAIDFDEYLFPVPSTTGVEIIGPDATSTVSYNLFDDASGAELAADNGDRADVTINYSTTDGGANSPSTRPRVVIRNPSGTYQITGQGGYSGTVPANNPGTRQSFSMEVLFADHLNITSLDLDTSSLNTRGGTWEFSVVTFLDTDGNPFSPIPVIPDYNSYGSGFTGPSGTGHYIAASTGTVLGVGTDNTSPGSSGPADSAAFDLSSADVTLPPGASIGGFVLTSTLEDVRGIADGASSFSSSLRTIDFSGSITLATEDADVSIQKSAQVENSTQITYELVVTNDGPDTATGVIVTDTLPSTISYISDDCAGVNGTSWTWSIGNLDPGDSIGCTIVTMASGPGSISNTASVNSNAIDPDSDNNTSTAVATINAATTTSTSTTTTSTPATTSTTIADVDGTTLETLPLTGYSSPGWVLIALTSMAVGLLVLSLAKEGKHTR